MPKYVIESDSLTGLVARIVLLLRKESPSIGKMDLACHDGSKVKISLASKKPVASCIPAHKTGTPVSGILVDGQPVTLE